MSRTTTGTVLSVQALTLGSVLDADALSGALTVTVLDATDFDSESGGSLAIGGAVYQYSSVDDDTGIITLTGTGLAAGASNGDRVDLWNPTRGTAAVEYRALVEVPGDVDNADVMDVPVALPLVLQLPEGQREPGEGEVVVLTEHDDEWVATDLPGGAPQVGSTLMPTIETSDFLLAPSGGRLLMYAATNPVVGLDDTTPGTRNYTVPAGVTVIKREGWGGGGGGGGQGTTGGAGGGGGGQYACDQVVIVNPGDVIPYTVGAAGAAGTGVAAGGDGGDTTMGTMVAKGGKGGQADTGVGGAGGTGGTGAVTHVGGHGASPGGFLAGGGGSSAAPTQDGTDAVGTAGAPGPGADAGPGGSGTQVISGFSGSLPAVAGGTPGGGGGGGRPGLGDGAAGGPGRLRITEYTGAPLSASIAAVAGTDPISGQAYPAGVMVYPATVTNWNNVTTPGTYIGIAGSQSNSPDDTKTWVGETYGRLETGTLVQVVNRLSSGDAVEQWSRQFSTGGGWRSWHAIYADDRWHNLTLKAGFTNVGPYTLTPAYRSKAGVLFLRGFAAGTFTAGGTNDIVAAGGIPVGSRPANDMYVPCAANGVANAAFLIIRADGSITVKSGATVPAWVSLPVPPWIGEV